MSRAQSSLVRSPFQGLSILARASQVRGQSNETSSCTQLAQVITITKPHLISRLNSLLHGSMVFVHHCATLGRQVIENPVNSGWCFTLGEFLPMGTRSFTHTLNRYALSIHDLLLIISQLCCSKQTDLRNGTTLLRTCFRHIQITLIQFGNYRIPIPNTTILTSL